jgi:hypothetical protein
MSNIRFRFIVSGFNGAEYKIESYRNPALHGKRVLYLSKPKMYYAPLWNYTEDEFELHINGRCGYLTWVSSRQPMPIEIGLAFQQMLDDEWQKFKARFPDCEEIEQSMLKGVAYWNVDTHEWIKTDFEN